MKGRKKKARREIFITKRKKRHEGKSGWHIFRSFCQIMSKRRINAPKNYPRICDIDIIDFNGKFFNLLGLDLTVPHPRMDNRSFVLLPLFEINKSWIHPKNKKNIVNLISNLRSDDIRSVKII